MAAAANGLEIARYGGVETGEADTPYDILVRKKMYKLRRYGEAPATRRGRSERPPVLLVPPMMLSADVFDVSPASSGVALLAEHGVDPWVVDFGAPDREEGGLERTLSDHVVAVADAISYVREATGRDVHVGGYSQGGMFCYQTAAYVRSEGIASIITFGSPVDLHTMVPNGVPEQLVLRGASALAENVLGSRGLPAWASRYGFRMLDPVKSVRQRVDFVRQLHDREALAKGDRQRRFMEGHGWVAYAGPALVELLQSIVAHNRMITGGFTIDGRLVTLADIDSPVLCFVGTTDTIAPDAGVRGITRAAPRAKLYEKRIPTGHFGLVVGSKANRESWPTVAEWVHWLGGGGEQPADVQPMEAVTDTPPDAANPLLEALNLATTLTLTVGEVSKQAAERSFRTFVELSGDARRQLPRIARLDRVGPRTRISLGSVLAEQAAKSPDATMFLFDGRAHTNADVGRRVDNIVRGLISLGVRQGEHVGVLMGTRPSAITVVAALSRLGAVAVLLRPDGPLAREIELGECSRVVCDPERVDDLRTVHAGIEILVLGGGGASRELGDDIIDMERIDPEAVEVPAWYGPNPGRARELAFILFTGDADRTRINRVTNGRWFLSSTLTATAGAFTASDTVLGVASVHHPSGLLMSIGGALAGGARLALVEGFDPDRFWQDVRQYGVSVVPYTWTQLDLLVRRPVDPLEGGHPIRLFLGSGMPTGLWERVTDRFAPAQVVELYAPLEGEAVIGNVTGKKLGSMGRPLPGSAKVRLAAFDLEHGRIAEGPDGYAQRADRGQIGVALVNAAHEHGATPSTPLRGVFSRGDAWFDTGDLFVRDDDGDYWLQGDAGDIVRHPDGAFLTGSVADALSQIDAVALASVWPVNGVKGAPGVEAAMSLEPGKRLTGAALASAVAGLPEAARPGRVIVVDPMPTTTWFRIREWDLRRDSDDVGVRATWLLDHPESATYTRSRRR